MDPSNARVVNSAPLDDAPSFANAVPFDDRDTPVPAIPFAALPAAIAAELSQHPDPAVLKDSLLRVLERAELCPSDWAPYAKFDLSKNYTRNLVVLHPDFSLIMLCWTNSSPIHDHPTQGCWMKVLQGGVRETRYTEVPGGDGALSKVDSREGREGEVLYISGVQGLHSVGAVDGAPAVTLHIYAPPILSCRAWLEGPTHAPAVVFPVYDTICGQHPDAESEGSVASADCGVENGSPTTPPPTVV